MISAIADRISEEMLHEGLILEEDRELYQYGFSCSFLGASSL